MNATTLLAYFSHIQKESGGANENSHLHRASACAEGPRLSLAFAALRFVSFRFVSFRQNLSSVNQWERSFFYVFLRQKTTSVNGP